MCLVLEAWGPYTEPTGGQGVQPSCYGDTVTVAGTQSLSAPQLLVSMGAAVVHRASVATPLLLDCLGTDWPFGPAAERALFLEHPPTQPLGGLFECRSLFNVSRRTICQVKKKGGQRLLENIWSKKVSFTNVCGSIFS